MANTTVKDYIPRWTVTNSSNIREAGYDPESRTLQVKFANGAIYDYGDVPPEVFDDMKKATSVGRFVNSQLRGTFSVTGMKAAGDDDG